MGWSSACGYCWDHCNNTCDSSERIAAQKKRAERARILQAEMKADAEKVEIMRKLKADTAAILNRLHPRDYTVTGHRTYIAAVCNYDIPPPWPPINDDVMNMEIKIGN